MKFCKQMSYNGSMPWQTKSQKNEMRMNVIEPASTDNLVFSGDEFNIRADNGFIDIKNYR
jgi:hypothetical protein